MCPFYTTFSYFFQLQQLTAAAKIENDKDDTTETSEDTPVLGVDDDDDDDNKDEKKDDDGNNDVAKAKSVWQSFRDAVKEIGKFSDNFLAALKNAPITSETRKDIADKLTEYKSLLQETKNELQVQRQKAQKLSNAFDNLIFFLLPDVDIVKDALKDFTTDEQKQKEVEYFRTIFVVIPQA